MLKMSNIINKDFSSFKNCAKYSDKDVCELLKPVLEYSYSKDMNIYSEQCNAVSDWKKSRSDLKDGVIPVETVSAIFMPNENYTIKRNNEKKINNNVLTLIHSLTAEFEIKNLFWFDDNEELWIECEDDYLSDDVYEHIKEKIYMFKVNNNFECLAFLLCSSQLKHNLMPVSDIELGRKE